jgi:hypothetical protein
MLKTKLQNQLIKSDKAEQNPNKKINPSKSNQNETAAKPKPES